MSGFTASRRRTLRRGAAKARHRLQTTAQLRRQPLRPKRLAAGSLQAAWHPQ